ncbi:carbamoyltransferase [Patescibacteria group bacterium]
MYILGISCFYHDSAAVLIKDGQVIAAAQEERFTRLKQDESFPRKAIDYCLNQAGITIKDVDHVGFYEKPFVKFERLLKTYLITAPRGLFSFLKAMPVWLKQKLWIKYLIQQELDWDGDISFVPHHLAHAASSFLVSPFKSAAILTLDGVGEWATATKGVGKGNQISLTHQLDFPHSLGLLYSAFTYYCGFKVNSGEYKLMGLSPYGKPKYVDLIKKYLIDIKPDGSFKLNLKYFSYQYALKMINHQFIKLFGNHGVRGSKDPLSQHYKDVAMSIQTVTEEIILKMAQDLHKTTKEKNLCLAGGVALNCVANGRIIRESPFKKLFIQPAAGDAGGAFGVAYYIYNSVLNHKRNFVLKQPYFGPEFTDKYIQAFLKKQNVKYKKFTSKSDLLKATAKKIADQRVIGWFQGRMEWGPRALGNRSILADARNPENQDRVNMKIKFREDFRPFAPVVMEEHSHKYFAIDRPSPYMLLVGQVKQPTIPAVTHVNNSARVQSVSRTQNPLYWGVINEFYKMTGCAVLINTSFNVRGEPIVCTPEEAYACFMGTNMDDVILGNYLVSKEKVAVSKKQSQHRHKFKPD